MHRIYYITYLFNFFFFLDRCTILHRTTHPHRLHPTHIRTDPPLPDTLLTRFDSSHPNPARSLTHHSRSKVRQAIPHSFEKVLTKDCRMVRVAIMINKVNHEPTSHLCLKHRESPILEEFSDRENSPQTTATAPSTSADFPGFCSI